ncbi:MAG: S8 family serine peptidase, partial [Gammaproteobacteria bacterium]|nr:S8 family serine peptidase [Gammaproteobacteria bacterium]
RPRAAKLSAALADPYGRVRLLPPGRASLFVVVKGFRGTGASAVHEALRRAGVEVLAELALEDAVVASVEPSAVDALTRLPEVRWVEPAEAQWQHETDRLIEAADSYSLYGQSPRGTGIRVGVFEGGHVRADNPDLAGRVVKADFSPLFPAGHTTMMAGIIAGDGEVSKANGGIPREWRGFATDARIFSYNFNAGPKAEPFEHILDYLFDLVAGTLLDDLQIMNNAWGTPECRDHPYGVYEGRSGALDDVSSGHLGRPVVVVMSAGNYRNGFNPPGNTNTEVLSGGCIQEREMPFLNYFNLAHPKAAKNVILAGGLDPQWRSPTLRASWGPTADGRLKPEVVAPSHFHGELQDGGIDRWVSVLTDKNGENPPFIKQSFTAPFGPLPNKPMYGNATGTSVSAAVVSGALARIIEEYRWNFPERPDPRPASMRALLAHTALDLDSSPNHFQPSNIFTVGPDYASGYGLVRVKAALEVVANRGIDEDELEHEEFRLHAISVAPGSGPLTVTLAWDDPAAADGVGHALINDLDLMLLAPDGTIHHPWTLNPEQPSLPAVRSRPDRRNNLEKVTVDRPIPGTWIVIVQGKDVGMGPQTFSLITDKAL